MNERITFPIAVVSAELTASMLLYLHAPTDTLCSSFPSLVSYAGQHGSLAVLLWAVVFGAAWLIGGSRLVRPRQNLSTKLRLLAWIGIVGIVIDNAVSLYELQSVSGPTTSIPFASLAERTLIYAITFAAVVLLSQFVSSRQTSTVTPPPRFGRE